MVKKIKKLSGIPFLVLVVIGVILVFVLLIASFQSRFTVQELGDYESQNKLIQYNYPLKFETEFCANKLTSIIREVHFLEDEIMRQRKEEFSGYADKFLKEEEVIIALEQQELPMIKEEFYTYSALCEEFDEQKTSSLCTQFIQEAKQHLELVKTNPKHDWGWVTRYKETTKAKRMYADLQDTCENTN